MRKKILIVCAIALSACALSWFIISKREYGPRHDMNVILITIEALQAKHLNCYGYPIQTSPNIDRLGREGVLFETAVSQSSLTFPALPALMTSRYPCENGILVMPQTTKFKDPTIAQILKRNGYATGAIVAHKLAHTDIGKGFDYAYFDIKMNASELTGRAIDWIKINGGKKIFLWLHYFDTHEKCEPPQAYIDKYLGRGFYKSGELAVAKDENDLGLIPAYVFRHNMHDPAFYNACYDAAINFTDENIGLLLDAVKQAGMEKNTLIILSADHGEFLGEHDVYFDHGHFLYDEVIRVPLIMKYSGVLPAGSVFKHIVGHIDIMPTILRLAGIWPPGACSGIDLAPSIIKQKAYPSRYIFSELPDIGKNAQVIEKYVCVRSDSSKLILDLNTNSPLLMDLLENPEESEDRPASGRYRTLFFKFKIEPYSKRALTTASHIEPQASDDIKKLKSLGYFQ